MFFAGEVGEGVVNSIDSLNGFEYFKFSKEINLTTVNFLEILVEMSSKIISLLLMKKVIINLVFFFNPGCCFFFLGGGG